MCTQQRIDNAMDMVQRQRMKDSVILLPSPCLLHAPYLRCQAGMGMQRACAT